MKEIIREYNMTDAKLCMVVSNIIVFIKRDSTEFEVRGVDAADVTAFEAMGDAYEIFPRDDEYLGLVMIEVDAKNALRETIINKIQGISGYLEQKWGIRSGQYKRLGIKNIEKIADNSFLIRSREVARIASEYIAVLSPLGLTQAMIDDLVSDAQLFEDRNNAVKDAKSIRASKTKERVNKGNELYTYLKQYSAIGKLIWENTDAAKYEDYIIYKKSQSGLGKVKSLAYDFPAKKLTWDELKYAEDYQLEFKPDSESKAWAVIYEGTETSYVQDPGAGTWLYRCRGHNESGYGDWSDELKEIILP